jgi:hypothetical protein
MIDPTNVYPRAARQWMGALAVALLASACAAPQPAMQPAQAGAPAIPPAQTQAARAAEQAKVEAQARALLAQAETDVQRARAKRALWLKAWEDLLSTRNEVAAHDYPQAIVHARSASELAQLGLEQLAYPAVK